ncbi:hypothetical protein [Methylobacterium oxalidis]|uniref:hypothetical protein n=1 Tax=Methylobacterium oxalidis TaxID=944322 RepID=UPI003315279C
MNLDHIASNPNGDFILDIFKGLSGRIRSEDWNVYAHRKQFDDLLGGAPTGTLTTYSLLKPRIFSGFEEVVIAGACINESMLVKLWTAQGHELGEVDDILKTNLRYQVHRNGPLISIYYATEEAWSKRFRNQSIKVDGKDLRFLDHIVAAIEEVVDGQPFVWMGNKDVPADIFGHLKAQQLPNSPHGLNGFQHVHNVVVLSALNPPPAHFKFMDIMGVDGEAMRTAHYRTAVYQAVMRCSIRNPADTSPKQVIVMDKDTAEWLAALFPGAQVKPLPGVTVQPAKGKPGRPRLHANNAAKAKAYRESQKQKQLAQSAKANKAPAGAVAAISEPGERAG